MAERSNGSWWTWFLLVAVLAGAGGGYYYIRHKHSEVLNFNTVTVTRGELTATVTATGTLNPVKSVQVGCQVSGRISDIFVDFNSEVKSGDLIARIDPRTYQALVESAQADLANATANLELQRVQERRAAELYTNHLVSASDYDTALATLHQAEASVKIKQASLDNARANLEYTKISSPVDGVVISRAVDVGQTVAASFNTPTLFLIANDLTKMQIDAAVSEADVGGVIEKQQVDFTVDAYPLRTFHGSVTQVRNSPTTVNNVVTYDAVIGVTNSDYKLKPGMTANVSIIAAQRENALRLPNAALRFRPPDNAVVLTNELVALPEATAAAAGPGGGKRKGNRNVRTVYVLTGDLEHAPALKPVQVKTGITDGISTEIVEGLKEDDKVVSGVINNDTQADAGSNPFGGGFPRRR
ncbi:MAG TPA: efflux RND transporter periplasmic adaptor subunit [Verrucomicrobiae bacterium]